VNEVYAKLLRTEYIRLPEAIRRVYLSPPLLSLPVDADGRSFRLVDPRAVNRPAPEALVPKLGIKGWRDGGSLGVIYQGVSIRQVLSRLLRRPTRSQIIASRAWTRTETPLHVHLASYVDFSEVSEVRFLVRQRRCHTTSACLRGSSASLVDGLRNDLAETALAMAAALPDDAYVIDLSVMPDGRIRVVDINPGLTPRDIAVLTG
jgi:hypothetical protein